VVKCTQCEKEYKNNAGLSSHMAMVHKMTRTGELLPEDAIKKREKGLKKAIHTHISNSHSPETRAKAGKTRTENHLNKLKEQGIHRCPECWETQHRAVDFKTPTELGQHRRFQHNVLGRSYTAMKLRKMTTAKLLSSKVTTEGQLQCPQCQRTFTKQHGLSIHIAQVHKPNALTTRSTQELMNGDGRTKDQHESPQTQISRSHKHQHESSQVAEALAIAHVTGIIENIILTTASRSELSSREFATRVVLALGQRYSS
jgi:hypothetical protein